MTSSWFFLSTLNYDARSTTHQIYCIIVNTTEWLVSRLQEVTFTLPDLLKLVYTFLQLSNILDLLFVSSFKFSLMSWKMVISYGWEFRSSWNHFMYNSTCRNVAVKQMKSVSCAHIWRYLCFQSVTVIQNYNYPARVGALLNTVGSEHTTVHF